MKIHAVLTFKVFMKPVNAQVEFSCNIPMTVIADAVMKVQA